MPLAPSSAQSDASRGNGVRSAGPATAAGPARSALNAVRHGLTGRTFFLLPDEDPQEFRAHEAEWLAAWRPRDLTEREAALAAIRAMWREIRGDRLEAQVLNDLFAAGRIADEGERTAAKAAAMKALAILLRYQGRIAREHRQAMVALAELRQRRLASAPLSRRHEPEPAARRMSAVIAKVDAAARPSEPEVSTAADAGATPPSALNRHQRRALAALERQATRRAA